MAIGKGLAELIEHSAELQHAAVDVKTRAERDERLKQAENDFPYFCRYYLPDYFSLPAAEYQKILYDVIQTKELTENQTERLREMVPEDFQDTYMDNFTIIGPNKRKLHRLTESIIQKLTPLGLWLKDDWQIYRIRTRNIEAVGYRFGFNATRFRKRTWKRMRRCILNLKRFIESGIEIPKKMIRSYLSRVGQLKHTARRKIQVKYLAGIKRKELIRRLNTA